MEERQFLDGLNPIQRRISDTLVSLSDNETRYIQAKDILRQLLVLDGKMSEEAFETGCDELNGHVGTIEQYPAESVGFAYRSLLVLGQPWLCRYPLFDLHGSYGDHHDDQPSGPDYLQVRMSHFQTRMVPDPAPPYLPLSLLNGTVSANGIRVPSHHLNELWIAMEEVRQNPEATLDSIVEIMPGPDFASGGTLIGNDSVFALYRDGKGILTVRGEVDILIEGPCTRVAITSVPPGVLVKTIVEQVRTLVLNQPDALAFKDHSTPGQVRIIIDAPRKWSPASLMSLLFKETALEQEFLFALPGSKPLLDVLRRGVKLCSAAWMKKSGDPSEFVPYLRDILKHGGYKSPLSLLGDERRTRIRNAR